MDEKKVYKFEIIRKLSRPRSYIITKQYGADMYSIIYRALSRIMGGK